MTKEELLEHLDRLIEQADITGVGLSVIREHLDEIHEDLVIQEAKHSHEE